jgi:RNA polymerase sigma factor (sigma-70 family)
VTVSEGQREEPPATFDEMLDDEDWGRTFGDAYPGLRAFADHEWTDPLVVEILHQVGADLLGRNAARQGYATVGELLERVEDEYLGWRGVGVAKGQAFQRGLEALDLRGRVLLELLPRLPEFLESENHSDLLPPELRLVAEWARFATGATSWGAVRHALEGAVPDDVAAAWAVIAETPTEVEEPESPLSILRTWIDELDEREQTILDGRIVRIEEQTLDQIGLEHGVSRERIRQVQSKLEKSLRERLTWPSWRTVGWAVDSLRAGLGALAPTSDLPALAADAPEAREFRVLLWFAGFEWLLEEGLVRRRGFTLPSVAGIPRLDPDATILDEEWLLVDLRQRGVIDSNLELAIERLKHVARVRDRLVWWPGNIAQKGVAVLAVAGHPMTADEVADEVDGDYNRRGFRDRLWNHPAVLRTSKTEVGLRTWGLDEYGGTVPEMIRIIETDGPTPLNVLARRIAEQFGISANSVMMYSAAPVFVVDKGVIRLRAGEPFAPATDPSGVAGLFISSRHQVCWHVLVDHDVLRGSGRKIPNDVALACGVKVGDAVQFEGPGNGISIRWSVTSHVGPAIGSMRSLAEDCGAASGDVMRLRFDLRNRSVTAEVRPRVQVAEGGVERRLSEYSGLPMEDCRSQESLALSVSVPVGELVAALKKRGDGLAADLARELPRSEE